eukprot:scaffold44852_cov40-Phaeocystis_antarctica.AAC.1
MEAEAKAEAKAEAGRRWGRRWRLRRRLRRRLGWRRRLEWWRADALELAQHGGGAARGRRVFGAPRNHRREVTRRHRRRPQHARPRSQHAENFKFGVKRRN